MGQFHLDRMDAFVRPAIVAGRPAALEAAVHDVAVCGRLSACGGDRRRDRGSAGLSAIVTDIEVGQLVIEQVGDFGADGVAVL
mgnify:CR=1 FL=1